MLRPFEPRLEMALASWSKCGPAKPRKEVDNLAFHQGIVVPYQILDCMVRDAVARERVSTCVFPHLREDCGNRSQIDRCSTWWDATEWLIIEPLHPNSRTSANGNADDPFRERTRCLAGIEVGKRAGLHA